jgi:hypothetical protein
MTPRTIYPERSFAAGPLAGEIIGGGAIAGIIGGVFMAMWAMLASAAAGMGLFAPFYFIGATFLGPEALVSGPGIALYGYALHLLVSVAFGVLFSAMVRRETPNSAAMLSGIAYGMGVLLFMTFIVVPLTNQVLRDRIPLHAGSFVIEHVLYGMGVALAPFMRRAIVRARSFTARA